MKIEQTSITKLKLTDLKGLDPVTVFIEDHEPGKGEITFKCYGKSWSYYWGGMGAGAVIPFFLSCNDDYLANCLWDHSRQQYEFDGDGLEKIIKKTLLARRREGFIEKTFARDMFDVSGWEDYMPRHTYDEWRCPMFVDEDEFKEFVEDRLCDIEIPERLVGDYCYLLRIIGAIKEAMMELQQPIAA